MSALHFRYAAAAADGRYARGSLTAASRDDAIRRLGQRGLTVIDLRQRATGLAPGERHASARDAAQGLRAMADLLAAGLAAHQVVAALVEAAPASWRVPLGDVRERLQSGASFADAITVPGLGLTPIALGIVRAGEAGGGLAAAVGRAAESEERAIATSTAIRSALAYPLLLLGAGTLSLGFLVGVVLPRFAAILADMGQALPPATRLVLGISSAVRHGALPLGLAITALTIALSLVRRRAQGAIELAAFALRVPIVGEIRHALATARVSAALAALLEAGQPIASALPLAAAAAGDAAVAERLRATRELVRTGGTLSGACAETRALSSLAVRLVRTGEDAGHLPLMLARAARLEADRALERTKQLVRIIEPTCIVGFGAAVALAAGALLQALYRVRPG